MFHYSFLNIEIVTSPGNFALKISLIFSGPLFSKTLPMFGPILFCVDFYNFLSALTCSLFCLPSLSPSGCSSDPSTKKMWSYNSLYLRPLAASLQLIKWTSLYMRPFIIWPIPTSPALFSVPFSFPHINSLCSSKTKPQKYGYNMQSTSMSHTHFSTC